MYLTLTAINTYGGSWQSAKPTFNDTAPGQNGQSHVPCRLALVVGDFCSFLGEPAGAIERL